MAVALSYYPGMKNISGFTLVELLVTLALVAILVTVGVPSFLTTIQNNRVTTQANNFVSAINLARSEAVKTGAIAHVEALSPTVGNEYGAGWRVWVDLNGNAALDLAATPPEEVREFAALDGGAVLNSGGPTDLQFLSSGGLNSAAVSLSLSIPNCAGDQIRTIAIALTGRADVTRSTCP